MAAADADQPQDEVVVPAGCVDAEVGRLLWANIDDISVLPREELFRALSHTTMCTACFEEALRRYMEYAARRRSKSCRDADEHGGGE